MCNRLYAFGFSLIIVLLSGCDRGNAEDFADMRQQAFVLAKKIEPSEVIIKTSWPARTRPYQIAEISPQISGIINIQYFMQGKEVHARQPIFQIDGKVFATDVKTATAALQRTHALLSLLQLKADHLNQLKNSSAVHIQNINDARANAAQAAAGIAEAKALATVQPLRKVYLDAPIPASVLKKLKTGSDAYSLS